MGNSRVEFLENSYYYLFNTTFSSELLFHNDEEFKKFYELLIKYLGLYQNIKLVSYSFVPHHFHLVVKNLETGHSISEFMRKLQVSYATWYRKRYPSEFKQPVFLGRFQSHILDNKEHFYKVLSYVNYNPLKYAPESNINELPYTSYHKLVQKQTQPYLNEKVLDYPELESKLRKNNP